MNDLWSYVLTAMGVTCFWLAGRKIWWAWYVGLATQVVWLAYSIATQQWGFLVGVVVYTAVYANNAREWTAHHRLGKEAERDQKWEEAVAAAEVAEPIEPVTPGITGGIYRKRALMVEARIWDGSYISAQELLEWLGGSGGYQSAVVPPQTNDVMPTEAQPAHLWVYTVEGALEVHRGWTIIKEPDAVATRRFSVLSPEDMVELYDLIEEGY